MITFPRKPWNCTVMLLIGCLTLSLGKASATADVFDAYLASIKKIRAYDVTNRIVQLRFVPSEEGGSPKTHSEDVFRSYQTRDVFVWGVGRRIEREPDMASREYMVAPWEAIDARSQANKASPFLPGMTYNDYFNPAVGNKLLSELLVDAESKVLPLTKTEDKHDEGMQIVNTRAGSACRVWFSSGKGGMITRLEWLKTVKNKFEVERVLEVSAFADKGDGLWMPSEGQITYFHLASPNAGSPMSGFKMETTGMGIILNSKDAETLVVESSLPQINRREGAWAYSYAPEIVKALDKADALWNSVERESGRHTYNIRIVLVIVLILLPAIFIYVARRSKHLASR